MSVTSAKVQSTMVVKFKIGMDAKGGDILKSQRFSKVKIQSTDESLFAVAQALGGLLQYPLVEVIREDQNLVINE